MPFINRCAECPYSGKAIGPRGNPASRIVLVGEAPGESEVRCGTPFVGPAGDVLWDAVADAGLRRRDVFVVNSVACRPFNPAKPKVRTPSSEAIEACHLRLTRQLRSHPRAVLVALGMTAIEALTGLREYRVLQRPSGSDLPSEWGPVVPTLHPAYVIYSGRGGAASERLVDDLGHARNVAGSAA